MSSQNPSSSASKDPVSVAPVSLNLKLWPQPLKQRLDRDRASAQAALKQLTDKTCRGSEFTGWVDWPKRAGFAELAAIDHLVKERKGIYDLIVVIGIGGSYLGTRAVADGLTHNYQGMMPKGKRSAPYVPIIFMGNTVSEPQFQDLLELLDHHDPIVNVVSKTGTTTEPAVAFRFVRSYLEKRYGKDGAKQRIVCTTDGKSGALRRMASESGYASFVVPPDVGGRFSILTAVGLVPLSLAGFDMRAMLAGADQVFRSLLDGAVSADHPVLTYAACRFGAYDMGKTIEILSFNNPKLVFLAEWWKQLFGESEGKEHKGLFPAQLLFTTDLHSLGQYAQDGRRDMIETFVRFGEQVPAWRNGQELKVPATESDVDELGYLQGKRVDVINDAALVATELAHVDGGVPAMELRVARIDESSFGAMFAFFEMACAVSAIMLGVNPFDQPGVEQYKKNLFALMGRKGYESLRAELQGRL